MAEFSTSLNSKILFWEQHVVIESCLQHSPRFVSDPATVFIVACLRIPLFHPPVLFTFRGVGCLARQRYESFCGDFCMEREAQFRPLYPPLNPKKTKSSTAPGTFPNLTHPDDGGSCSFLLPAQFHVLTDHGFLSLLRCDLLHTTGFTRDNNLDDDHSYPLRPENMIIH